ncbi:potassium channel subfamily T member 2-like protein, partial [Dinothrombium tinctorium]
DFYVVLLSPCELDTTMKMILQVPMWAQRVIYIQGSALKDTDLMRAKMNAAEACFILATRNSANRSAADEHTILRSWAIRDFAPNVPQYVQIFRPENKIHVAFAEHVVCEDEFKYALLANNCLCPGTSTLVTLLLHTSRGQEGQISSEEWQRLYGKCSGNEIYHIRLGDSRFFGEYQGKSFTYASFHSHRKYGVALIGVQTDMKGTWPIMLNPGPSYILKSSDICFYMNITKEENSAFLPASNTSSNDLQKEASSKNKTSEANKDSEHLQIADVDIIRKLSTVSSISAGDYNISGTPGERGALMDMIAGTSELRGSSSELDTLGKRLKRDASPARIAKAMSELAAKTKKAISRKSGLHLEVPRIEYGYSSRDSSPVDVVAARGRRPSIAAVPAMFVDDSQEDEEENEERRKKEGNTSVEILLVTPPECSELVKNIAKGFPPVSPYVGVSPTLCYLMKEKRPPCCVLLSSSCEHCPFNNAKEYKWSNRCIILAADFASNAIYNFIVPLRAYFHSPQALQPIILLLERRPNSAFIDAISWFPMVYWMMGCIDDLDDLIKAGINIADSVVVVNKESTNSAEEDYLADCNTIVAVQSMFKMFPSVRIITELSQSSNMRFMQFRAHDAYALSLSKTEKHERERGSHISYMFRLPFAAGSVFSASMLDTLLYQAFVKDYMITIIRLLLGIDQAPGSGFLSSMKIGKDDLWIRTYGRLYQKLCSTSCEIPIGIYRTQGSNTPDVNTINLDFVFPALNERMRYQQLSAEIERQEIGNLVKNRMQDLGFPIEDYDDVSEKRSTLSYVIINPCCDLKLEEGDVIYLIRPSPIKSKKTFLTRGNSIRGSKASVRRRDQRGSLSSQDLSNQTLTQPKVITTNAEEDNEPLKTISGAVESKSALGANPNFFDNKCFLYADSDQEVNDQNLISSNILESDNKPQSIDVQSLMANGELIRGKEAHDFSVVKWLFSNEELHAILDESGDSEEYFDFLATNDEHIEDVSLHEVNCSKRGYWREQKLGAAPKRCGTLVTDALVTAAEAQTLRKMAQRLIDAIGDTSTYNRESLNLKWVNLHNVFRKAPRKLFSKRDFDLIKNTSELAKYIISYTFEIPLEKLYFTNVTQFTRHRPVTQFSEFRHVDKVRSPSIVVTSILWLSTVDYDFYGGRTEFLTGGPEPFTPILVEPKIGRFAAWTSAYENPHGVKEIYAGDRYALIFAFTVNP